MSDERPRCTAEGCKRVLTPRCSEHRDDMVPRGAFESLKSNHRGSVSSGIRKDEELATAKARMVRYREALDELVAACDETWDSKPYDVAMSTARTALAEGAE